MCSLRHLLIYQYYDLIFVVSLKLLTYFFHRNVKVYFKALFSNVETESDFVFSGLFGIFFIFFTFDSAVSFALFLWRNELR